jgi:hypothetical protein
VWQGKWSNSWSNRTYGWIQMSLDARWREEENGEGFVAKVHRGAENRRKQWHEELSYCHGRHGCFMQEMVRWCGMWLLGVQLFQLF